MVLITVLCCIKTPFHPYLHAKVSTVWVGGCQTIAGSAPVGLLKGVVQVVDDGDPVAMFQEAENSMRSCGRRVWLSIAIKNRCGGNGANRSERGGKQACFVVH